ncbi:hypothetical protein STEG23_034406, partial [Scotinomys teguina]
YLAVSSVKQEFEGPSFLAKFSGHLSMGLACTVDTTFCQTVQLFILDDVFPLKCELSVKSRNKGMFQYFACKFAYAPHEGQKWAIEAVKLEYQPIMSCHVGTIDYLVRAIVNITWEINDDGTKNVESESGRLSGNYILISATFAYKLIQKPVSWHH